MRKRKRWRIVPYSAAVGSADARLVLGEEIDWARHWRGAAEVDVADAGDVAGVGVGVDAAATAAVEFDADHQVRQRLRRRIDAEKPRVDEERLEDAEKKTVLDVAVAVNEDDVGDVEF